MAKSNIEVTMESFAANERGDQEALRELMDPEIEIYAEPGTRGVGRGAGSGLEIDRVFAYLYEIQDGMGTRFHVYGSKERALEAAAELAGVEG